MKRVRKEKPQSPATEPGYVGLRKLIVVILAMLLVAFNGKLGLNMGPDAILWLASIVMTYLFGQSGIDLVKQIMGMRK